MKGLKCSQRFWDTFKKMHEETGGDTKKLCEIYCLTERQIQHLKRALDAEKRIYEINPKIFSQLRPSHKIVLAQVENDKLSDVLNAIEAETKKSINVEKIPTVEKTKKIIKSILGKPTNQRPKCEFKKITEELVEIISNNRDKNCGNCHIKEICNKNKDAISRLANEIKLYIEEGGYIKVLAIEEKS